MYDMKNSLRTYQPLITIVGYVVLWTIVTVTWSPSIMWAFMGMFFFFFSLFKLLDVSWFAKSYSRYDIIAERTNMWGYIYPFVELILWVSYLLWVMHSSLHIVTWVIMFIGLIWVSRAVIFKQKIACACLGAWFNLPMSIVTIIENFSMLIMAIWMLVL